MRLLTLALISAAALGTGCLSFDENGRYACSAGASCPSAGGGGLGNEVEVPPTFDGGNEPKADSGTVVIVDAGGMVEADPVRGLVLTRYYSGNAEVTRSRAVSGAPVQAWVQEGMGWKAYPGSVDGNGAFTVPGVPTGTKMYLRVGSEIIHSSAREFDLSVFAYGRPGAAVATSASTNLLLSASGATTWKNTDCLQVTSLSAGLTLYAGIPPSSGTTLDNYTVNFGSRILVDSMQGDSLLVSQLTADSQTGYNYCSLRKAFTVSNVRMLDGQNVTASGVFADVPQLQYTIDWRRAEFDAYRALVAPTVESATAYIFVDAVPRGITRGLYSNFPRLISHNNTVLTNLSMTVQFGNPFSGTDPLGETYLAFRQSYAATGATTALGQDARISVWSPLGEFVSQPVRPRISPVRNVLINGQSAFLSRAGIGGSPTLSWDAPELGTPSLYFISLFRLRLAGTGTAADLVAGIVTQDREVTVPPDLMVVGGEYFFMVTARQDPGRTITQPGFSTGIAGRADVLTAMVKP